MKRLLFVFFVMCIAACFGGGIEKTGSVVDYHNGTVKTYGGGAFALGPLSPVWQKKKIKERAVLFLNHNDGATITVSSWCKSAFDDASLPVLSDQLLIGLSDIKRIETENQSIHGREALRTSVTGRADGVPVYFRSYVLKMNACVFDFFYVASPEVAPSVNDFETLVQGFAFLKEPKS